MSIAAYDRYLDAVNAGADDDRLAILTECTTDDLEIRSPGYVVRGRAAVAEKLGTVVAALPTPVRMERLTADEHHDVQRVGWRGVRPDDTTAVTGEHIVDLRDGRVAGIVVFIDTP